MGGGYLSLLLEKPMSMRRTEDDGKEMVRDTGFEYVGFTDRNLLFDPMVTKR